MKQQPPAFQFYCRDWLASSKIPAMTDKQFRAYVNLLAHAWLNNPVGSLPDDDKILAALSGIGRKAWPAAAEMVRSCFEKRGSRLFNLKLESQFLERDRMGQAFHERAKLGASKRWKSADNQHQLDAKSMSQAMLKDASAFAPATATAKTPPPTPPTGGDAPSPESRKTPAFKKPTEPEINAYCQDHGFSGFDAISFLAYYESNGWRVGRNPMKNWKGAVVTWHKRNLERGGGHRPAPRQPYYPTAAELKAQGVI